MQNIENKYEIQTRVSRRGDGPIPQGGGGEEPHIHRNPTAQSHGGRGPEPTTQPNPAPNPPAPCDDDHHRGVGPGLCHTYDSVWLSLRLSTTCSTAGCSIRIHDLVARDVAHEIQVMDGVD